MYKPLCEGLKQNFCANRADVQVVTAGLSYAGVKQLGNKISWTWLCRDCSDDRALNDWELINSYTEDGRIDRYIGVVMPIEGQIPKGRDKYFERAFTKWKHIEGYVEEIKLK